MNPAKIFRLLGTPNHTDYAYYERWVTREEKTQHIKTWKKNKVLVISTLRAIVVLTAVVLIVEGIKTSVAKIGSQVTYGTYQAFTGDSCDGPNVGNVDTIGFYHRCIDITGRSSFRIEGNFTNAVAVVTYELLDCDVNGYYGKQRDYSTKGVCGLIDTSHNWSSAYVWVEP